MPFYHPTWTKQSRAQSVDKQDAGDGSPTAEVKKIDEGQPAELSAAPKAEPGMQRDAPTLPTATVLQTV